MLSDEGPEGQISARDPQLEKTARASVLSISKQSVSLSNLNLGNNSALRELIEYADNNTGAISGRDRG